ncbi:hypothetical protein F5984_23655 [Rudanella paleaurantiibacter]|uniref:ATP-binding protein n=1 Tax=Rudanella paleaurantiibacter TaxID=2614655 RepID=A0A7J5TSQ7_9BACT|nr:hypothetical protein [Rudanella paleaurantiibacter]KAB7726626.1 hypothetical protein F5984_23655 [Rudanella paleaurantiibacter]
MEAELVEEKLKGHWRIDDLLLIAEYRRSEKNPRYGYFTNCTANDRKVFYPFVEGHAQAERVVLHLLHNENLIIGKHYAVRVKPAIKNRSTNPYLVEIDEVLEIEGYESPQEFIKKWFSRKGENPGDAATIASQLRLNELELYTQTERFIFELLQNADDMPTSGKKVNVRMELLGDYFLFLHDGKFFDRNDVMAIADAARSTKSRDKTKTGYKGIGFKSVFTDSNRVFIRSQSYSFKFDKLHPIYSDFWQLYAKYMEDSSESKRVEIRREYTGREAEFTQIERIPWQIKPIWVELADYPDELKRSDFWASQNVAIALEIGQATLAEKQYDQKISKLLCEPRFLLFLRNITSVSYTHNDQKSTLALQTAGPQLEIRRNDRLQATYEKWDAEITISNESFTEAGLQFQKRALQDGKYEFVTQDGQQVKNIPEKLAILERTTLTFAAQIEEDKIKRVDKDEAILFNYLPTSDKRFAFPFLVNGDFVTKTDREFILHENLWNQYLFYHIGYSHINWLSRLSKSNRHPASYLNLLVSDLKDEKHPSESDINAAFNRGVRKAVSDLPFIRSVTGYVELPANIILDEVRLAKVLGTSFFYAFTGTSKQMPDSRIEPAILRRAFLSIDRFEIKEFVDRLAQDESVKILAGAVSGLNELRYNAFLDWLHVHCKENTNLLGPILPNLPILRFGNEVVSWSAIANQDDYLLIDNRTKDLPAELSALGFKVSSVNIDLFPAIKSAFQTRDTYLDSDVVLYDKVSERCSQYSLEPEQKAALFSLFVGLNRVGDEKHTRTLRLFSDEQGVQRPLDKLLNRNIEGLPHWLTSYTIREPEFKVLPPAARNALVKSSTLFSKLLCDPNVLTDCTQHLDSQNVAEWGRQLQLWRAKDSITPTAGWNDLPWLYTNDTHRFQAAAALWDHHVLTAIPAQAVIESLTGWLMPHPDSQTLIEHFGLAIRSAPLTTSIIHTDKTLSKAETRLLIDFLEKANEAAFLTEWTISATEAGYQLSKLLNQTVYAADASIQSFIKTSGLDDRFVTMPDGLADTDTLAAIGAVTGDALLNLLIEQQATLALAPLLLKRSDPKLYATYLHKLPVLAISSSAIYSPESPEVQVLKMARNLQEPESSAAFQALLDKTMLDGLPISECSDFSDMVQVELVSGKEPYEFSTADLLPNNANRIDRIEKAIKAFSSCSKLVSERFLREKVFSAKTLKPADAESEIFKATPTYLTPIQVVFLQVRRLAQSQLPPIQTKHFFDHWSEKKREAKAWAELGTYLNLLHDKGIEESHIPLGLEHCVIDPDYCLEPDELLPDFYAKWADTEDKKTFLTKFSDGPNGPDSDVVKLRKALLNSDDATAKVCQRTLDNPLRINTLNWLSAQQNDEFVTACIGCIGEMLNKIEWPADQQPIVPIITSIEASVKTYRLAEFANQVVHTWSDDWKPYETEIHSLLTTQKAWVVENSFPVALDKLIGKLATICPNRELAKDILEGSTSPSAPFYETWELKDEYPIHVIQSNRIPWQVWYDDQLVSVEEDGESYFNEETSTTYLTAKPAKSFPLNLPECFPETPRNELYELALKSREHPEDEPRSQRKFYTPEFERIIGGDELNDIQQGKEFKSAVLRGIPYLEEQGFDFSESEVSLGLHFMNVKRAGFKDPYNITFRSAKRGLLYLNLGAWKRLGVNNEVLIVVYQGGEMRLFSSKEELLAEKWNEYMLYRVEKPDKIDANYEGITLHEKTTHLLFVTSEKMYQSLYQDKLAQRTNKSINAATSTPDEL